MAKNSTYKVLGICTDTIMRNGKILLKNGKRMYGAVGWYRIVNPLKKLGAEIAIGYGIQASAESALELKEKGDIWYMKIADNEGIDHIYGAHKEFTGAKIILDLDDDPDHIDPAHPDYQKLLDKRDMRMRMIKIADHVVAATQGIKDAIKDINPYCTVIPNSIDPKIWGKNKKKNDGIIRIGWIASGSHFADLPLIKTVVDDILNKYKNVEFHFAGMTYGNTKGDRVYHHTGTTGYKPFPKFYANMGVDIAIAPLKDNQFNRCKSNIKWMEAAMLEIPMVASDVTPYRCIKHGETGYLSTTPNQMTKYLGWLIENKELRERIGKNAKEEVLKNWTVDKFLPQYEELFKNMLDKKDITVVTSITGGKDELNEQPQYKGVDYVAFLDKEVNDPHWKIRKACDKFVEPVMNAKIHKVLTHKYVDTEYIVWLDGNCILKQDPHELVKLLGNKDFAFFKHPGRDCLYDEAEACVRLQKGKLEEISHQIKQYSKTGFPPHNGLSELTCFIRKNNEHANEVFEKWWAEICRFSNRDQLSFPVIFKDEKYAVIPGSIADGKDFGGSDKNFPGNEFFKYKKHLK